MIESKNHNINHLVNNLSKKLGSYVLIGEVEIDPASQEAGESLAKTAINEIANALESGEINNVSLNDRIIMRAFAKGPELADEVIRFGIFPAFYDPQDRGLRCDALAMLRNNVRSYHHEPLLRLRMKILNIDYSTKEDLANGVDEETNDNLNKEDQYAIDTVLAATGVYSNA